MMRRRRARFAYVLILPALIVITLLDLYPVVEGVIVSMQNQNQMRANPEAFVGTLHYVRALSDDPVFWPSVGRTLVWTAGAVVGGYLVALGLALLLDRQLRARNFFRALFLLPWVIPDVATALLWRWLYGDEFGVFNFVLRQTGLSEWPIQFLADPNLAMVSVIAVQIWKLYPVMFIVLLAALQTVPRELHEAAIIDGATARQRFRYITLPFIRATSVIISLLASIWTFQSFDLVYLLTGGGPSDATRILSTLIYQKAFWGQELGYASALGLLMLVCLLAISIAYLFIYRTQRDVAT
jgi:multiple sugar transport system permease protein